MSTKNNGGPAFPCLQDPDFAEVGEKLTGMSLRDWFAGQALGSIPLRGWDHIYPASEIFREWARTAYAVADAMLAEREK